MSIDRLSVNALLKFLTTGTSITMPQAISIATALIKEGYNSEAKLLNLNVAAFDKLGIEDKQLRKALLDMGKKSKRQKKKRTRDSDMDFPLAQSSDVEQGSSKGKRTKDYSFQEITDLDELATKFVVVNRAPVMTAWATVVCERLAFTREEALSLAQAYTELNAVAKGASLGILPKPKPDESSQPYVEIMGRSVPVIGLQDGKWRGLVDGQQADPDRAFTYMRKSFQQQLGAVIGAMKHLANSFQPNELNEKGYGLYCSFRPASGKWAERSEFRLDEVLSLRRFLTHKTNPVAKMEPSSPVKREDELPPQSQATEDRPSKRAKLKEEEDEFDDLDWSAYENLELP